MNNDEYRSILETIDRKVGEVSSDLKSYMGESATWRKGTDDRILIMEQDVAKFKTIASTLFKVVVGLTVAFNVLANTFGTIIKKVVPWLFS